jgi:ABC-2 type transport system ATP-binding protein
MLDVRGLTKKYRNRAVVDHVTFTVPPGEVTGYLGPNGSGKSTTVKMLAGLLPATSGQILWDGVDIRSNSNPNAFSFLVISRYRNPASRPIHAATTIV